ncbi:hypothetical protein N7G274_009043 [Stereocaulon virgatum]|uniref:NADH dehydrogenase [ubiquinone] 1 beta subcomplex subunit 7 n=1 Tax=Stereocaulon virgatum TaxID=373712 RepID=A0ABR3ZYM1_9LECA
MTVTEDVKNTVKDVLETKEQPRKRQQRRSSFPQAALSNFQCPLGLLLMPSPTITGRATREEMSAARLPLAYRDSCAHLLIPLNRCRFEEYYLPWKCVDERHSYEKCQYDEFKKRVAKMDEIRAAKGGARSN